MKYIIDNSIEFNSDDDSLVYLVTNDLLHLPIPASRLLEEILSSDGHVLTREYLLENVWDKHGLRGTGNNLKQYMSILRRNLSLFECNDLIITLPKIGFQLNTKIYVSSVVSLPSAHSTIKPISIHKENPENFGLTNLLLFFFIAFLVTASVVLWYFLSPNDSIQVTKLSDVSCPIFYTKSIRTEDKSIILEKINNILVSNKLNCTKSNVIIYGDDIGSISKKNRRTLLSFCTLNDNKNFSSCENYYEYKNQDDQM
jgi:DNA-binding winged helix-turn-helix (wHTH) protein